MLSTVYTGNTKQIRADVGRAGTSRGRIQTLMRLLVVVVGGGGGRRRRVGKGGMLSYSTSSV